MRWSAIANWMGLKALKALKALIVICFPRAIDERLNVCCLDADTPIPEREKQDVASVVVGRGEIANRRDYDVEHYLQVLVTSYAARLRKAFSGDDFEQLFRLDGQEGLFDRSVEDIEPRWIRCSL